MTTSPSFMSEKDGRPTGRAVDAAAHTPGPWRYNGGSTGCVQRDYEGEFHMVASVYGERGPEGISSSSELKANARLIAAAPELLVALNELFVFHEFGDVLVTSSKIEEISAAVDRARAAISKATGGEA